MKKLPYLLKDTWNFFSANLWGIWGILLPLIVPESLLSILLQALFPSEAVVSRLMDIVFVLLYPIIQAATIFYISSVVAGEALSRSTCYRFALKFWAPLFGLYVIGTLAIAAGLVLLIIPGLIVLARLMFSDFYCLLYEQSSINAFSSSWEQTKEHQWVLLAGVVIIAIATSVPMWLLQQSVESIGIFTAFFLFVIGLIEYLLGSLITIFGFSVFTLHIQQLNNQSQRGASNDSPLL